MNTKKASATIRFIMTGLTASFLIACGAADQGLGSTQASLQSAENAAPSAASPFTVELAGGLEDNLAVQDDPRPNVLSIQVSPANPTANSNLDCAVTASADATVKIEWLVDQVPVAQGEALAGPHEKGTSIGCIAYVYEKDGRVESVESSYVVVGNSPPEVTAMKLTSDAEGAFTCDIKVSDPDGDDVELGYAWLVNGEKVSGDAYQLAPGNAQLKDTVTCLVTPHDGDTFGKTASADLLLEGK